MRKRSRFVVLGAVLALMLSMTVVAAAANSAPKWKPYGGAFNTDDRNTFVSSFVNAEPNTPSRVTVGLTKNGKVNVTISAGCTVDGQTVSKVITKKVKDGTVVKVKWPDGVEDGTNCSVNAFGSHFTLNPKKHTTDVLVEMKK